MSDVFKEKKISVKDVLDILSEGFSLALSKECRAYIIFPIIANIVILFTLSYLTIHYVINDFITWIDSSLPSFLSFLSSIVFFIAVVFLILICSYLFSTVATIIASPFYGLLAQKVEEVKTNKKLEDNMTIAELLLKETPRILKRELQKQWFFLPKALLLLVLALIPLINLIVPLLWVILTSYMAWLQYCDYSYDNHKITFKDMKKDLNYAFVPTLSLGFLTYMGLNVIILNILIPPVAVCSGTLFYLKMQQSYGLQRDI